MAKCPAHAPPSKPQWVCADLVNNACLRLTSPLLVASAFDADNIMHKLARFLYEQVMLVVVERSSDAVKQAVMEGGVVLRIFGDWLLTAADATISGEQQTASSARDICAWSCSDAQVVKVRTEADLPCMGVINCAATSRSLLCI